MKLSAVVFLIATASASVSTVTPIQKVLQLLDGMSVKGKQAKHVEEVEFAKFSEWCDGVRAAKTKSIAEGASQITQLEADIEKAETEAEVLASEVKELQASIAEAQGEEKSASALRETEHADYQTQHTDYSESIDAVERAINVLRSKSANVPQSLAQVQSSKLVPEQAKAVLASFLAEGADAAAKTEAGVGAPEANAYEFQSGSVIGILEKLESRFREEKFALEKAEINSRSNHQMLMQQLHDNINADTDTASKKTSAKAGRTENAASWKGELALTQQSKADDETTLADTNTECHSKSDEFEKNQVTRAEEIKAIQKAIEILSSAAVSGHADTHLPASALLQAKKAVAFAQLRSESAKDPETRQRVVAYLQAQSTKLSSRYLLVIANHVADDPFDKVKKMIKDLITKLMEEANDEADHHAYCTSELATNKQTRDNKGAEVEELSAEVDQLTSSINQLATEVQQLSDELSEIAGQRAEATKLRVEEKGANTQAISDSKEAQLAVEKAIQVLREFYDKDPADAGSAALLQNRAGAKQGTKLAVTHAAKEPYEGMMDGKGGVLGLLDVILSDFTRLESETSAAEDTAASAHDRYMAESEQDAAVKNTEKSHKDGKREQAEELLRSTRKELSQTHEELSTALDYFDKLKADCLDTGVSTERRKQERQEEIVSLQEALRILSGEDFDAPTR